MYILLADAMKPLNVLSKFENHFAIRTVRFQVQLEADGYFLLRRFLCLHPQQAGWVGTNLQFSNPILQIQLQNACWASPKPDIPHKIALATRFRWYRISKFSWRKICSMKIGVDSFNIASNRNYHFRFWRYRSQKPLIVTTNLTLDEIRHPQDTAHARIYDRLLEMCVPISCIGVSFRKENAQEKLERLKLLIG